LRWLYIPAKSLSDASPIPIRGYDWVKQPLVHGVKSKKPFSLAQDDRGRLIEDMTSSPGCSWRPACTAAGKH
jgi:hypothetical protein